MLTMTLYAALRLAPPHHSAEPGGSEAWRFVQNLRSFFISATASGRSPTTACRNPTRVDGARATPGGTGPLTGTLGSTVSGLMFQVCMMLGYIPEKSTTWTF